MKVKNTFVFDEENVKNIKPSGKKVDIYYDSGCRGLAIRMTNLRQVPVYIVVINYGTGSTQRNIGAVGVVSLKRAREIATNILRNKREFLAMKFSRGESLSADFDKKGFLPRLNGALPLEPVEVRVNPKEYERVVEENYKLKKILESVSENINGMADTLIGIMKVIKRGE